MTDPRKVHIKKIGEKSKLDEQENSKMNGIKIKQVNQFLMYQLFLLIFREEYG